MKESRLPKRILKYAVDNGGKGWVKDLTMVLSELLLPPMSAGVLYDIEVVESAIKAKSREMWCEDVSNKPKLDCCEVSKDRGNPNTPAKSNLHRFNRRLIAKLICGILPLEREIGRYTNVKKELRFCRVCNLPRVECEYHSYLYDCTALQLERSAFYVDHITDLQPLFCSLTGKW